MMLACTVFFYRLGEAEYSSGLWLAGVSLGLWLAASFLLGLGWLSCLLVQAVLFAALSLWNVVRSPIKK
jgi:hypothetical protein